MQKSGVLSGRKILPYILVALLVVLGLFALTGCSEEINEDTFRKQGYTVAVTYNFMGGSVGSKSEVRILVKENSLLPAPKNENSGVGIPNRSGYSFKTFCVAKTDANGNVEKDANNRPIPSDTVWDFSKDKITNKDITLCAVWWDNYKVVVNYGDNYVEKKTIDVSRNIAGEAASLFESAFLVNDYTFLSYNLTKDDDGTAIEKFPCAFTAEQFAASADKLTVNVWVKSLKGSYTVVRSSSDLNVPDENTNFYVLNDIDMKGAEYDDSKPGRKLPKVYNGKFIGNGHKIGNFTLKLAVSNALDKNFGLFRTLGGNAEISNITFENVNISVTLSDKSVTRYNIGVLAGAIEGGAKVSNVKVTASADKSSVLTYLVDVGIDSDIVKSDVNLLYGQKDDTAQITNSVAEKVDLYKSMAVRTADGKYEVYVKYTVKNGVITLGKDSIYALAEHYKDEIYDEKTIVKLEQKSANEYIITRYGDETQNVVFTVSESNVSVTVTDPKKN